MKPPAEAPRPLLPEGAFVVQFRAGTDLRPDHMEGRVEHVVSGEATRFESLGCLVAFFTRVLTAAEARQR